MGDCVLTAMGALLRRVGRQTDTHCRWGGEEFVVALHQCELDDAAKAAERLRSEIEQTPVVGEDGTYISVTASLGVAEYSSTDTIDTLIDRADRSMYEAKTSGRNRVRPILGAEAKAAASNSDQKEDGL